MFKLHKAACTRTELWAIHQLAVTIARASISKTTFCISSEYKNFICGAKFDLNEKLKFECTATLVETTTFKNFLDYF